METDNAENPFPQTIDLEITDVLDLHSFSPKETKAVVRAYLDDANKKGFRIVRIIHGKGIGVQREIVRSVLADSKVVKSFKNAPEFSGSWGSTIVELVS